MSRSRKFVVVTALILAFTILTSGQTAQPVQLVVGPVIQKDATIQVALTLARRLLKAALGDRERIA